MYNSLENYNRTNWYWKLNGVIFSSATMSYVATCPEDQYTNIDSEENLYEVIKDLENSENVFTDITKKNNSFNKKLTAKIRQIELQDVVGRPIRESILQDVNHPLYNKYLEIENQISLLRNQFK